MSTAACLRLFAVLWLLATRFVHVDEGRRVLVLTTSSGPEQRLDRYTFKAGHVTKTRIPKFSTSSSSSEDRIDGAQKNLAVQLTIFNKACEEFVKSQ